MSFGENLPVRCLPTPIVSVVHVRYWCMNIKYIFLVTPVLFCVVIPTFSINSFWSLLLNSSFLWKFSFLLVSLVEFLVCDKNFLGLSCWIPLFRWFFCWFLYDGEKFLVGSYLGSFSMEINFWLVLLLVSLRRGESFSWFFFGVSEKSSVGSLLVSLRNL